MCNKMLYVLAGYDDATEDHLSNLQKGLLEKGFIGKQTMGIPQHITLGSFPVEEEERLVEQLKQVGKDVKPLQVSFSHIGMFQNAEVLFVAPDSNQQLIELKENFGSHYGWAPHTTMLIDRAEVIFQAVPLVAQQFQAFTGMVTWLHLYEFWPTRHILSIELGI